MLKMLMFPKVLKLPMGFNALKVLMGRKVLTFLKTLKMLMFHKVLKMLTVLEMLKLLTVLKVRTVLKMLMLMFHKCPSCSMLNAHTAPSAWACRTVEFRMREKIIRVCERIVTNELIKA